MHIPDGYLGPATYGGAWAVMVPIWRHASKKVQQTVQTAEIPFLAMGTVFSLVAMMFMLPLPGGTTGHISGATLVAILLGPWPAMIAVSISVVIQAVLLGDGGLTAISANCFNIAFVGAVGGWSIYALILRLGTRSAEHPPGPGSALPAASLSLRLTAAAVASYAAINLGALMAALELGSQPLLYAGSQGATYFPFPLKVAIPALMVPHLAMIGLLEAGVTVLVLAFVHKTEGTMKGLTKAAVVLLFTILAVFFGSAARAHSIHYDVQQKAMGVRIYYSENDPAADSQYELYGPGDKQPYQTGRTDKNGYIGFVPDRPGTWKLQVWGESSHGFHGVTTEIKVDQALNLESFSKPLVATHTKLVTGISVAFGVFGLYALWVSRGGGSRVARK
jgi:ABC-type Co2+ transport system permease subunit